MFFASLLSAFWFLCFSTFNFCCRFLMRVKHRNYTTPGLVFISVKFFFSFLPFAFVCICGPFSCQINPAVGQTMKVKAKRMREIKVKFNLTLSRNTLYAGPLYWIFSLSSSSSQIYNHTQGFSLQPMSNALLPSSSEMILVCPHQFTLRWWRW